MSMLTFSLPYSSSAKVPYSSLIRSSSRNSSASFMSGSCHKVKIQTNNTNTMQQQYFGRQSSIQQWHVNSLQASRRRGISCSSSISSSIQEKCVKREDVITSDPNNNVSEHIFTKLGINLHQKDAHPLGILKGAIYSYFDTKHPGKFTKHDDLVPIVGIKSNFDEILIPADHVSRSSNDTFYIDGSSCLRCHTSAHQTEMLRNGETCFLVTGDVYRRDTIDATHYPVFHQMEGFRVFDPEILKEKAEEDGDDGTQFCLRELKSELEGLARHLFGDVEMKWVDAYFPFTDPSAELEIYFNGDWMEVLGCGVVQQVILDNNGRAGHKAWAFGLGLERLAMVLFDIPDIRLFWSNDKRFLSQFEEGNMHSKFVSYSKYPPVFKDMSFWTSTSFTENNLCSLVRDVAGDLAEEVKLIDSFTHPKSGKQSECYRITYRSMERSLTNEEIDSLQEIVRSESVEKLGIELR